MKSRAGLAVGAVVLAAAGLVAWTRHGGPLPERAAAERPALALLTSLPIAFGERFALDAPPSPAMARLQRRYRVETVAVADAANLKDHRLLLMAHPRAQPASALVDLDQWVRGGGRVLLMADPKSDWPSELGLGDRFRPPSMFADTGLLLHWGLRLEGRPNGPREIAGIEVDTQSPGSLTATGRGCSVAADGFVAECAIGRGRVTVVADSDFLNADGDTPAFDALDRALERLESR